MFFNLLLLIRLNLFSPSLRVSRIKSYFRYLVLLLFIGSAIIDSTAQTSPNQPNILLIISDDLGVDNSNGYQESARLPNTPNLDALRANGLTFKNAWASPVCTPTRANIMSGKYGIKTGVLEVPGVLETTHTSIFREIATQTNNAYANALIGKWHLSGPSTDYTIPRQHGINHYEGSARGAVQNYYNWEKISNETASRETEYATTYYTNSAIDWIGNQNQPWFMWLAHNAPHSPLHVPPSDLFTIANTNNDQGKYIAMIEAMDTEIGRLLNNIPADVLANTIIIYIGDNGTPNGLLQNFPNRHGKGSLYQGGVHVPMIVAGAGVTRQNEEEEAMIHATDIYATILELTGTELAGGIYNSLSFKHLLTGSNGPKRIFNYAEEGNDWTIRNTQYKLIQLTNGRQEFYDLIADPLEEVNLINNLTANQQTIKLELETEGTQIRTGWSCNDFILNGEEMTIDGNCDDADMIISSVQDLAYFSLAIYPNPATDLLILQSEEGLKSNLTLSLYDSTGKLILQKQVNRGTAVHSIDVSNFENGAYILQLSDGISVGRQKILVMHP